MGEGEGEGYEEEMIKSLPLSQELLAFYRHRLRETMRTTTNNTTNRNRNRNHISTA